MTADPDHTGNAKDDEDASSSDSGFASPPSPSSLFSPASFQYRLSHHKGVTQIAIRGAVEDEDKEAFRKVLFHSSKVKAGDIALDLGAVTFLSESALAVLIQLLKAQHAQGASLRLVHLSPWVRKKLERTAILQFFAVDN